MISSRKGILIALGCAVVAAGALAWTARAEDKILATPPARKTAAAAPPVEIVLGADEGTATPSHAGNSGHAGGGNITVNRIDAATVAITMTGAAVAKGDTAFHDTSAGYQFDYSQCFEVVFNSPDVKSAKLTVEGVVLGRLRSYCECPIACKKGGTAQITTPGSAVVASGAAEVVALHMPAREACCCESQTVRNHEGPISLPVQPGKYTLHQQFGFVASTPSSALFTKFAAADFSPECVLDLRSLGFPEPFLLYGNKDFGFTVTVKVAPE